MDPFFAARTFALLFGLGGTVVLATLPLNAGPGVSSIGLIAPAVLAVAVAFALALAPQIFPQPLLMAMPTLGTTLSSVVIAAAAAELMPAYAMFYFWVIVSAVLMYGRIAGFANFALVAPLYLLVLDLRGVSEPFVWWLMTMITMTLMLLLVGALRARGELLVSRLQHRLGEQHAVGDLGRYALDASGFAEVASHTPSVVRDALGASAVAVWAHLPGESAFVITDWTGTEPAALHGAGTVVGDSGLICPPGEGIVVDDLTGSSAADARLLVNQDLRSCVAVPIPNPIGNAGVLAAYSTEPAAFDEADVAFLTGVANVLAKSAERHRLIDEAWQRRRFDPLTGRPNRLHFLEKLAALVEAPEPEPVTLYVVDVDGLEQMNQEYGRETGDEVIKAVPARLKSALPHSEMLAYLGGGAYAVMAEGVEDEFEAVRLAEKLLATFTDQLQIGGRGIAVAATVGIATATAREGLGAEELLSRAEGAVHRLKQSGRRGQYGYFDELTQRRTQRVISLESELRGADARGELALEFEPIVRLGDGTPAAYEALLRWHHPEQGTIPPADFIPAAERSGLMAPIGAWVVEEIGRRVAAFNAGGRGEPPPVHINVSAFELTEPGFAAGLRRSMQRYGLSPAGLRIEITEQVLFDDEHSAQRALAAVRALGAGIVLDDFGTGFASLTQLKRFPIDTVKIDRTFVSRVEDDGPDAAIVTASIAMARSLGLTAIAEGIERPGQAERLLALGCEYGQGFLYRDRERAAGGPPYSPGAEAPGVSHGDSTSN